MNVMTWQFPQNFRRSSKLAAVIYILPTWPPDHPVIIAGLAKKDKRIRSPEIKKTTFGGPVLWIGIGLDLHFIIISK